MRYEWFIAKRYLKPQGGATFIFHLTLFSIAGVALGVASLVTVLSVMNGFGNDLRGKIMEGRSHLNLTFFQNGVAQYPRLIEEFTKLDNIAAGAPVIEGEGMVYRTDYAKNHPVLFFGIDPDYEPGVTHLDTKLLAGSLDELRPDQSSTSGKMVKITDLPAMKKGGVIIGKELARDFFGVWDGEGVDRKEAYSQALGRTITLLTLPDDFSATELRPKMETLRVAGVFETGHFEFDYSWVFVSLPTARNLTSQPQDVVSGIRFRLDDFSEKATSTTQQALYERSDELLGTGVPVGWMNMDPVFFEALRIEKATMNYILKIIILVATFNIIATLFMIVMAKTMDIGLLRAIGASRRSILKIFLILGVFVGMIGTVTGIAGGYGICLYIQHFHLELPGEGSVYNLKYLPCDIEAMDFIGVAVYTFFISLIASIYPAIRASKLAPVDALRYS